MGKPLFNHASFLDAARQLACEVGPAAVTVDLVAERLKAPKGSFYYRFASRDALLGELWLATALRFQQGYMAAIEAGDGLAAALHTPAWVRDNLDDGRLMMLYSRHDFVAGEWPEALRKGVAEQSERFTASLHRFASEEFGRAGASELRRAAFALVEVPLVAVKQHLQRREKPPKLVDELISQTYQAIVGAASKRRPPA